jgi:hypothetical protein
MSKDVLISVIRSHLEESGVLAVPLIYDLFDKVATFIHPEPNRAFVGTPAGVALNPKSHVTQLSRSVVRDWQAQSRGRIFSRFRHPDRPIG